MAITTPTRKTMKSSRSPTRPTMKKKSPYKAAKASPKATYSTKKLSPTNGNGKSLTKQEKMQARILARKRAQEWAKRELGKKKVPSPADSPGVIVIDDDDDDDTKDDHKMCVDNKKKPSTTTATTATNKKKSKTLNQHLSGLDIDNNQKVTEDDDDSGKGDVFYDALGCLPKQKKNDSDIAVEDVSDEEDDGEIRGLNSTQCNLQPSEGQSWMEPLDSPSKKNQEPCGKSFSTFTPVKPEPNGTSFSTFSQPEPAIEQEESKGWGILNMFSTFSASKAEPKKQQEP